MQNNKNYNKRRRSYTEFRKSYSDNKKYFISTDKTGKGQTVLKYFLIGLFFLLVALSSFLVTDALIEVSEEPVITTTETTTEKTTLPPVTVTVPAVEPGSDKEEPTGAVSDEAVTGEFQTETEETTSEMTAETTAASDHGTEETDSQ